MSEKSKAEIAAEEFAYDKIKIGMRKGYIPADAGTLEIAEYAFMACARWLLAECEKEAQETIMHNGLREDRAVPLDKIKELVNGK